MGHERRSGALAVVITILLVTTVQLIPSSSNAAAPGTSVLPAGIPLTYGVPNPGEWTHTTGEDVLHGEAERCEVLNPGARTRGDAVILETAPGRFELWSDAGLGQDTVVQLTMWQTFYNVEYKYNVPWTSTGVQEIQGRARVEATSEQPTDALAVVEVQYSEIRHLLDDPTTALQVKWAVRVNLDGTTWLWIFDPDDPKDGVWSQLALDQPLPVGILQDVPVTARFTVNGDTDTYNDTVQILVGDKIHTANIDGIAAGAAEVPRVPRTQNGDPIPGAAIPDGAVDPSITFSLENSSAARYDACRPRVNNERAVTRYELEYSGILESANAQNHCADLDCLAAGTDFGPRCANRLVTVDLGLGDQPTRRADVILGTSGADVIRARGGNDVVCGGPGGDVIIGGAGTDLLLGGDGADTLRGSAGDDTLDGQAGDDRLYGNNGNDTISGGDGQDFVSGGGHADIIDGGAGDDRLRGGSGNDRITGASGNDTLWGGANNDVLEGSADDDRLLGGKGNDSLIGGGGADFARGGSGSDACAAEIERSCEGPAVLSATVEATA